MINVEKLKLILEGYKAYFPIHWEDEKYKWEAIKHFQDHWNINAENFGDMFKQATDKTFNLLASGYAFQALKQSNYDEVSSEQFEQAQDLFAAILLKGAAQQLKQGLYREYITQNETLSVMRGKLDMPGTIRNRIQRKQQLACEFDERCSSSLTSTRFTLGMSIRFLPM